MGNDEVLKQDGLSLPEIGQWSLEKHRLMRYYEEIFSNSMKNRWPRRIYLDLFAGAGYSLVKGTGEIVPSSALIALNVRPPFTRHVFCDLNPDHIEALRTRQTRHHPGASCGYVVGDCNAAIDEIVAKAAEGKGFKDSLSFCLVDPFGADLDFKTLRALSDACGKVDFLVLVAFDVDLRRNWRLYLQPTNLTVDRMIGHSAWRSKAAKDVRNPGDFIQLVASEFCKSMETLKYISPPPKVWMGIGTGDKALYHLLFFSKHELGHKFWNDVLKYAPNQGRLL